MACWRAEGRRDASSVVLAKPREGAGDVARTWLYTPVTRAGSWTRATARRERSMPAIPQLLAANPTGTFAARGQWHNCGIPVKRRGAVNLTVANTQSGPAYLVAIRSTRPAERGVAELGGGQYADCNAIILPLCRGRCSRLELFTSSGRS